MTRGIHKRSRVFLLAILGLTPAVCLVAPIAASAASPVEKLQEFGLDIEDRITSFSWAC